RILLTTMDDGSAPTKFTRRQFPVKAAFAMTINKTQGQKLQHVNVYLSQHVFGAGQLYVGFSRCTHRYFFFFFLAIAASRDTVFQQYSYYTKSLILFCLVYNSFLLLLLDSKHIQLVLFFFFFFFFYAWCYNRQ
ncbi:hypothetical protein BC939DRAFT_394425, partial [Gamsiella multidivaricata]|uniref:uncharacterized protein n=1 Tax=Gamsiella multidivaricata TaxID=101098 RepID=UPI002220B404